jgi:surface antigen
MKEEVMDIMRFRVPLILLSCLVSTPAFSMDWSFLKDAPASHFSDGDFQMMTIAAHEALENEPDGAVHAWRNLATGDRGSLTLLSTNQVQGKTCRKVKIWNSAADQTAESVFTFCKQNDGSWKVTG